MPATRAKPNTKTKSVKPRRKSLVLDREVAEEVARLRGTSISAAIRDAVEHVLAVEDMMDAIRALHEIGAFRDYTDPFLEEAEG